MVSALSGEGQFNLLSGAEVCPVPLSARSGPHASSLLHAPLPPCTGRIRADGGLEEGTGVTAFTRYLKSQNMLPRTSITPPLQGN